MGGPGLPGPLPLNQASFYNANSMSGLIPTSGAPAESPTEGLVDPLPARTADPATVAANMRQLSTSPEHRAPMINGDWTINQDHNDPAVLQFQRDLQNY